MARSKRYRLLKVTARNAREALHPNHPLAAEHGGQISTRLIQIDQLAALARWEYIHRRFIKGDGVSARVFLNRIGRLSEVLNQMLPTTQQGPRPVYLREALALSLARSLCAGLHLQFADAYAKGRRQSTQSLTAGVRRRVSDLEFAYRGHLSALRQAALAGSPGALIATFAALTGTAEGELLDLCREVARRTRGGNSQQLVFGLRTCRLARKWTALCAAPLVLQSRLATGRRRSALKQVAEARVSAIRPFLHYAHARRVLHDHGDHPPEILIGKVAAVRWLDRPRKPFSLLELEGSPGLVLAPYKSLPQRGVDRGRYVIIKGKVKRNGADHRYLELEFEGLNQFARSHWEDYLFSEIRSAYDLYPESLHMEWEYAALDRPAGIADLVARQAH